MLGPVHTPLIRPSRLGSVLPTVMLMILCVVGLVLSHSTRLTNLSPVADVRTSVVVETQPSPWPVTMIHLWWLVPQLLPHDS